MAGSSSAPTDAELRAAYQGKRVLLTGHTGFKGSWLTTWLHDLGAEVTGYALAPEEPSLFAALGLDALCKHHVADVRDLARFREVVRASRPDYVLHLAAQALVRDSYARPIETIETNVMGTANVLEAVRLEKQPCAVVVVSSDKCYENREWVWGYREEDPMGGHDVYSMSKGATELVTASYRRSFFDPAKAKDHGVYLASARAGNVIGGGDWAKDRLIPDMVRAVSSGAPLVVRNPDSVRPWQHVLEPLSGYLLLGARLAGFGLGPRATRESYCEGWNFGPRLDSTRKVRELADALVAEFAAAPWVDGHDPSAPHEAALLRLSIEKAFARLAWQPRWGFEETVARTVAWYAAYRREPSRASMLKLTREQITAYVAA